MTIRVLTAADHAVVRTGLAAVIAAGPDYELVARAPDRRAAVATYAARRAGAVLEFEAYAPQFGRDGDAAVICTCRRQRLGGGAVVEMVRMPPVVIVRESARRNPLFPVPGHVLPGFRRWRAQRDVSRTTVS